MQVLGIKSRTGIIEVSMPKYATFPALLLTYNYSINKPIRRIARPMIVTANACCQLNKKSDSQKAAPNIAPQVNHANLSFAFPIS